MSVEKVTESCKAYFRDVMGRPGTAIGVQKAEGGWKVLFEAVDDRGAGFDPTLGLYEVGLDKELKVTDYKRLRLRKTSQMSWGALLE